jgi:DNA-binding transcriptional regulator YhcF (GntR family)
MSLPDSPARQIARPVPLRQSVYEAILDMIVERTLRPGQHLVENELAVMLGVSRQPVREALQWLKNDGWVDLRPGHGAFVHAPSVEEADQLLAVRALLETESARLAATHATDEDIKQLREVCRQVVGLERGDARASPRSRPTTWPAWSPPTPTCTPLWPSSPATGCSSSSPPRSTAGSAGTTPRSPASAASSPGGSTPR